MSVPIRPRRITRPLWPHLLLLAVLFACIPELNASEPVNFSTEIRTLLSNSCFECHGPDENERKANLRLDTFQGATFVSDGHAAVVPGKPMESELIRRIFSTDPKEQMPPPKSGKSLSTEQKESLRLWIEQGAEWDEHWAFIPPTRPDVPPVEPSSWAKNAIDHFVLSRLNEQNLAPSPPADNETLLRRLYLDLIGLPPSIDEINSYASQPEAVIEPLLSSPHFGERWGRKWLDAARYADSDGFEKDKPRFVWHYRDWVINSLNQDLPYDQFVIEQIAGDLLPDPTQDQLIATGFLRNSMINEEGGADPEQFRVEAMFDRMDAIGKSILGITISCAQCHTHKFDPITHTEYFGMFAFLNNSHEAAIAVYTDQEREKRQAILKEIAQAENQLKQNHPDWAAQMAAWSETVVYNTPWETLIGTWNDETLGGQKMLLQDDGSYLAQGYAPTKHGPMITVETDLPRTTALRLELLTDPNLPLSGPGRSIWGTGALTEFEVHAAPSDKPDQFTPVKISHATADLNLPEQELASIYDDRSDAKRVTGPISYAIDGKNETAWGTDAGPGRSNQPRKAVFNFAEPVSHPNGTIFRVVLRQNHGGWNSDDNQNCNLGRIRLSATDADEPVADPLPQKVREALELPLSERSENQTARIFSHWRTTMPEWQESNDHITLLWKDHPRGTSQLVLQERSEPRPTFRMDRGDFLSPAEEVQPGVPEFLNDLPKTDNPTRLDFARWMVDREAPTTARSIVNRLWQSYFGTGLVATSEDLGSQAEMPSHPELLDWLAVELMENNWSLKHIHRLIVNSATYQQSSNVTPDLLEKDPYNRNLARSSRLRLEAEAVRDVALSASGLLNPSLGGPSVYPPAPEFLFEPPASYGPKTWTTDNGEDRYRRAVYTFRFRSVPYPALQAFDAPQGDASCVRRSRSNTPLQALTTLNEPLFVESAQALARRVLAEAGPSDQERIEHAFRTCVTRPPQPDEYRVLENMLHQQLERFTDGDLDPIDITGDQDATPDLAAWTTLSRVLLNLDETITRE